jgi:hypothetical protein
MNHFESLNEQEKQTLFDAIPLISILVAGADGEIDEVESTWAEKLTHIRTFDDKSERVHNYYEHIDGFVQERIESYRKMLSNDPKQRQAEISTELAKLNTILPKLDHYYASDLYKSFVSFAHHIAEASGGIFRFLTIGPKEDKVVDLPMIEPIVG